MRFGETNFTIEIRNLKKEIKAEVKEERRAESKESRGFLARQNASAVLCFVMDEIEFRKKCEAALETLRRRLLELADEHGFEVEGEGGKLDILFEEPEETKFVISPNTPARQIWISALSTSFKLGWTESAGAFVLDKSGENLNAVMSRILSQQLGRIISV